MHVLFILFGWFQRWEVGGHTVAALCLFNIACSILVQLLSSFFSVHLVSVYVVHLYTKIDTTAAWKRLHFILSDKSDFHMIDNLLRAVHAFGRCKLMSFSVEETLLSRYVNLSPNFREPPFRVEIEYTWE